MSSKDIRPENLLLIKDFLKYKIEFSQFGARSWDIYFTDLCLYAQFLEQRKKSLLTAVTQDLLDYRSSLESYAPASLKLKFIILKTFYRWAASPAINLIEHNPYPTGVYTGRRSFDIRFIPTCKQLFKIRTHRLVDSSSAKSIWPLRRALIIELLASSGARIGELLQTRACDISFAVQLLDNELQKQSPFVAGSITLNVKYGAEIKRKNKRILFFSPIACKLLCEYVYRLGIPYTSPLPLFPFKRRTVSSFLTKISNDVITSREAFHKSFQRKRGCLDIDVTLLPDGDYKEALKKIQEAELAKQKAGFSKPVAASPKVLTVNLYPHSFRHFFGCCMYYRDFFGSRRNIVAARDLLGHSETKMTEKYLSLQQMVCTNDDDWKRIYIGNGFEYRRLFS